MNKELIQEVTNKILENPEHFSIGMWMRSNCKTTACIGGWAIALSEEADITEDFEMHELGEPLSHESARNALGISRKKGNHLFYLGDWPEHFQKLYELAETPEGRAYAAARRISQMCPEIEEPPEEYLPEDDKSILNSLN